MKGLGGGETGESVVGQSCLFGGSGYGMKESEILQILFRCFAHGSRFANSSNRGGDERMGEVK